MERVTRAQSQAPAVHVGISALQPREEILIGVLFQSTANAVWVHTASAAATLDIPIPSTPACQPPCANLRTIN